MFQHRTAYINLCAAYAHQMSRMYINLPIDLSWKIVLHIWPRFVLFISWGWLLQFYICILFLLKIVLQMGITSLYFSSFFIFCLLFLPLFCISELPQIVTIDVHAASHLLRSGHSYIDVRYLLKNGKLLMVSCVLSLYQ